MKTAGSRAGADEATGIEPIQPGPEQKFFMNMPFRKNTAGL